MPRSRAPLAPLALTAGLLKPVAVWIRDLNGRRTLADMPDYLLRDIGLRRDQLDCLAAGDDAAPAVAPAGAPRSAEVVALASAKRARKPGSPETPMAA